MLSLAWLLGSFLSARASLITAHDHGAVAAQSLVQAEIALLQARADESLTLINRSGDDGNEADFKKAAKLLGPDPAAGMVIASLLMVAGCAWGLTRRIAEYR